MKGDRVNAPFMSSQDIQTLARLNIPDTNGRVIAAAYYSLAIRAVGHGVHSTRMPRQYLVASAGMDIPQTHRLILTAAGDILLVGAKVYRAYPFSMSLQRRHGASR